VRIVRQPAAARLCVELLRRVVAFDEDEGGESKELPPAQESGAKTVGSERQANVGHVEAHVVEGVPFGHGAFGNVRSARQERSAGGVVDCNFKRDLFCAVAAAAVAMHVAFKAGISADSGVHLATELINALDHGRKQVAWGFVRGGG
jgi:hypothetical protein